MWAGCLLGVVELSQEGAYLQFPPFLLPSLPINRDFEKNEYELKKALLAEGVSPIENKDNGVVWAGYDSPFVYVNRHNEVWVRVA